MLYAFLLICSIDAAPDAMPDAVVSVTVEVAALPSVTETTAGTPSDKAPHPYGTPSSVVTTEAKTSASSGCANGRCPLPGAVTRAPSRPAPAASAERRWFRWRR